MVRDNECMYAVKTESSALTHHLLCMYAGSHLGCAAVHGGSFPGESGL